MKTILLGLTCLFTLAAGEAFSWPWSPTKDDKDKIYNYPFNFDRIYPFIIKHIEGNGNCIYRLKYTLSLKYETDEGIITSLNGHDPYLNLHVTLFFSDQVPGLASECIVIDKEGTQYKSTQIFQVNLSHKRSVYLINFNDFMTHLFIHHSTDKSRATGCWYLPHNYFPDGRSPKSFDDTIMTQDGVDYIHFAQNL